MFRPHVIPQFVLADFTIETEVHHPTSALLAKMERLLQAPNGKEFRTVRLVAHSSAAARSRDRAPAGRPFLSRSL
jgi:hypothetical protein